MPCAARRRALRAGAATFLLLLGAGLTSGLSAQTTASGTATITIPPVLSISVTNTSITFPEPAAADLDAGSIAALQSSVISHSGNLRHGVNLKANAALMTGSGGLGGANSVRDDKPASDLEVRINGAGAWLGLSSTDDIPVVTNATKGTYTDAASVSYRMLLSYADTPGVYSLSFTYTVVAQ